VRGCDRNVLAAADSGNAAALSAANIEWVVLCSASRRARGRYAAANAVRLASRMIADALTLDLSHAK